MYLEKVTQHNICITMATSPPPPMPSPEDMKAIRAVRDEEVGWLPPNPAQKRNVYVEKMMENPLVPIGELNMANKWHPSRLLYCS